WSHACEAPQCSSIRAEVQTDSCDAQARFDRRRGRCKSLGGFNARANALLRILAVIHATGGRTRIHCRVVVPGGTRTTSTRRRTGRHSSILIGGSVEGSAGVWRAARRQRMRQPPTPEMQPEPAWASVLSPNARRLL